MAADPTVFLELSSLPLRGSVVMGGAREANSWFHNSAFLSAMVAGLLCCLSIPATSTGLCCNGRRGGHSLCSSYTSGCCVRAVAWLITASVLAGATVGAEPCSLVPVLPPLLIPINPPSDAWISQEDFVCWARDPLLSYSCLTCQFKERNKEAFSLCHEADVGENELISMVVLKKFLSIEKCKYF